jgi:hypothetical protein
MGIADDCKGALDNTQSVDGNILDIAPENTKAIVHVIQRRHIY